MGTARHNATNDSESGEFLATLAAEHTSDTTEFLREARTLPPVVPLMAPYADRGEVARGHGGSVRRAWDDDLGRHVAVRSSPRSSWATRRRSSASSRSRALSG